MSGMDEQDARLQFDGQFDDGKDPQALRTIGEVARGLGIRQHVLRYWEEQFPTLRPVKRSGGRRYYRPEDVTLLAQIDRLVHREGYTLRGAAQAIARAVPSTGGNPASFQSAATPLDEDARRRLTAIRAALAEALAEA